MYHYNRTRALLGAAAAAGASPPAGLAWAPAAVYRFDGDLADATAAGRHLALASGTANYLAAKFSSGLYFNAAANASRTQDLLTGALNTATYSVSLWWRGGGGAGEVARVRFRTAALADTLEVRLDFGGAEERVRVRFDAAAASTPAAAFPTVFPALAHVAASVAGGLCQVWVNGVQVVTDFVVTPAVSFDPAGTLLVDGISDSLLDDVGIAQAALTQAHVDYLYNAGAGNPYPIA